MYIYIYIYIYIYRNDKSVSLLLFHTFHNILFFYKLRILEYSLKHLSGIRTNIS